jgi:hypothetical protein
MENVLTFKSLTIIILNYGTYLCGDPFQGFPDINRSCIGCSSGQCPINPIMYVGCHAEKKARVQREELAVRDGVDLKYG